MSPSAPSHRERVRLALSHQLADRVPIAMVCSGINPPAHADLSAYLRETRGLTVEEYLDPLIDIASVAPDYVGPQLGPGEDIWGVVRSPMSYGRGTYDEIEHYPLALATSPRDLEAHRWPTTAWFDYTSLPVQIARTNRGSPFCIMVRGGNLFETSWYMRGFQQSFLDMALAPGLVQDILTRVTDFYIAHTREMLRAGDGEIDLVFTADDIGGQQGLLMSLDTWQTFLKSHHARMNEAVHQFGAKVIYHTDGAVMRAVPGLIEMGVDVLQALQFDVKGMDPVALKRDFGDRLCFEGGISVQKTLPFGTAEEVREEVLARIAVLGKKGGYILGPAHAIQAGTPPENIVAMFDTASSSRLG